MKRYVMSWNEFKNKKVEIKKGSYSEHVESKGDNKTVDTLEDAKKISINNKDKKGKAGDYDSVLDDPKKKVIKNESTLDKASVDKKEVPTTEDTKEKNKGVGEAKTKNLAYAKKKLHVNENEESKEKKEEKEEPVEGEEKEKKEENK